jgi:hypothetical protein
MIEQLRNCHPGLRILCTSPFAIVPYVPGESHLQMPFTASALTAKVRALLDEGHENTAAH